MLVLDANILVRAVLGRRVRGLLARYATAAEFLTPDVALADARRHLPKVLAKRGIAVEPAMAVLGALTGIVRTVGAETYGSYEVAARERLKYRDPGDWPVLATALTFDCPIWTEDADFFGVGVAIWTTDRVELFLQGQK